MCIRDRLDQKLQEINSDYEAKRFHDVTLQHLELSLIHISGIMNAMQAIMRNRDKLTLIVGGDVYKRQILCCPPNLPLLFSHSLKSPGLAFTISRCWRVTS